MAEYTIGVDGMECQGCERVLRSRLTDLSGVTDAVADAHAGEVRVYGDPAIQKRVQQAVVDAGYEVSD